MNGVNLPNSVSLSPTSPSALNSRATFISRQPIRSRRIRPTRAPRGRAAEDRQVVGRNFEPLDEAVLAQRPMQPGQAIAGHVHH